MKYFSPSYWFKLWLLSVPLFNDETIGINAKSINNNQKIKNWASNNTNLQSINQNMTSNNYELYNLNDHQTNKNIDHFYQTELETSSHKHRHEKSRRIKRGVNSNRENAIEFKKDPWGDYINGEIYASFTPTFWEEVSYLQRTSDNKDQFIQSFKNKVTSGVWKDYRLEGFYDPTYNAMEGLGKAIWDNWININNVWQESSKNKMIRVEIKTWWQINHRSFSFLNSHIRGDSVILSNPYLKPDLISDFKTCINPVDNTNDETILKAIKSKNPSVDTSQVYVKEKTINGRLTIGVKSDSWKYNTKSTAWCDKWEIKPDLISDFKTCINPVDNTNDETILKAIKSKNPSVDTSQVYVKEKTINGRLTIGVKSDSNKYNINSSASCNNFQVKPETTTSVVSKPIQQTTTSTPQTIISISSSQHQNGYVSKSGYTLEELRNQKYNFDFQQAQINYQSNQNQNDYTNAQQRFVQAQNDYILHIQQGQPLLSSNQQTTTSTPQTITRRFLNENNEIHSYSYYLNYGTFSSRKIINQAIGKNILASAIDSKNNYYVSTEKGLFCINVADIGNGFFYKEIKNIKNREPISEIFVQTNDNVYFIAINGDLYFLNKADINNFQSLSLSQYSPKIKNVLTITEKKGEMYIVTDNGVYCWNQQIEDISKLSKIKGIDEPIFKISSINNNLYFLSIKGNFFVTGIRFDIVDNVWKANLLTIENNVLTFTETESGVYIGTNKGASYWGEEDDTSDGWSVKKIFKLSKIKGINEPIAQIVRKGSSLYYYLISVNGKIYNHNSDFSMSAWEITKDYKDLKNTLLAVSNSYGDMYFATDHGVYFKPKNSWIITKIEGINEPIAQIFVTTNNNVHFESFSLFSNNQNNKYRRNQNENPEIIVDDENEQNLQGIELLHILQSQGDYGLVPVNRINRGYLNFVNSFNNVLSHLINQGIIINYNDLENFRFERGIPYRLTNTNSDEYFIVNVNIRSNQNRRLQLVFRNSNLYLQGFVTRDGSSYMSSGIYYYFRGENIINNLRDITISRNQQLPMTESYTSSTGLNAIMSNPSINWNSIINSFIDLLNYNGRNDIRNSLIRVIFATAESWRFNNLFTWIAQVSERFPNIEVSYPWNNFHNQLTSWGSRSDFEGPLDIETVYDRNENFIDLRHLEHLFLSTLRIANSKNFFPGPSRRHKRNVFNKNTNITNIESDSQKILNNKNIFKWTDDFSKEINHEQHLPPITNNSNYVTNNITNL